MTALKLLLDATMPRGGVTMCAQQGQKELDAVSVEALFARFRHLKTVAI